MTARLLEARRLIGAPVVELATGDALADVRDVVIDPSTGTLTGFTLNRHRDGFMARLFGGRSKEVLLLADVHAVGDHAVVVASSTALTDPEHPESSPVAAADPAQDEVLFDRVITESGHELGSVTDVVVTAGRAPRVVGYRITRTSGADAFVPLRAQTTVSGSSLIVPDTYEAMLAGDPSGLATTIDALEEAGS